MGCAAIGRIAIAAKVCRIGAAEGGTARAAVGGGAVGGRAFARARIGIYRKGLAVGVGSTGKPSLGITVSTVSALDAQRYNMVVGAYVNSVNSGSCAETAGLKQGDIITAVNGEEITNYEELVNAKNKMSAGDQMTLDVWRDGETTTLTVTLDEAKPDTSGSTDNSQSGSSGQSDSNNQYGSNGQSGGNGMSPYDFFNYFFGGNGNSNGGQGSW